MDNIWLLTNICMGMYEPYQESKQSIIWYKSLSIFQKISLKELSGSICGVPFEVLSNLFGLRGAISLLHEKLVLEKII